MRACFGALVLILLAFSAATAQLRPAVTTGQPTPVGGTFDRFSVEALPVVAPLNARGQVAFFASVARGRAEEGIFLATGARIVKIAASGDRAPVGGTFSGFGKHPVPALNGAGSVAFAAAVVGGATVEGVFLSRHGKLEAVAVAGGAAPGIAAGTLAVVDAPALNDRHDVAFLATVRRGRETAEAIYLRTGRTLRKVVALGDAAPAGGTFAGFGVPTLNARGAVAFAAVVDGPAVPGGVFIAEGDKIRMVAGAGDDAPTGGFFAKLSERVALNDAGAVAFIAHLKNAPVASAVFVVDGRGPSKIVAIGDAAPGGGTFSYLGLWPALNDKGAVAFVASVDRGATPIGVFVADGARIARVAGVGDAVSGGDRLQSLGLYPAVSQSPGGDVVFAATTGGAGSEGLFVAAGPGAR
jgi:hypothetical protein